jgi:hypothetical protein
MSTPRSWAPIVSSRKKDALWQLTRPPVAAGQTARNGTDLCRYGTEHFAAKGRVRMQSNLRVKLVSIIRRTAWLPAVAGGVGIALASAGAAMAQSTSLTPQDPSIGGQLNQCWGVVASQLAQLDGATGGGMGNHSRSTTAANNVGGFASSNNQLNITLNARDLNAPNQAGGVPSRQGVGNVSAGSIHQTPTGDGGNGQHGINNGEFFSPQLNPVTGVGPGPTLSCDLGDPNIVR